jgi:hypothetical protein
MDPSRLQERSLMAAVERRRVHISGLVVRNGKLLGPRWNLRFFS